MEGRQSKIKVWVNGTFDVMHIGHIKLLEFASTYGVVRVGIDSDNRVREKKGKDRPINNINSRMEFMNSIKYVDSVVSFDSDEILIEKIKEWDADIMVIGDDYNTNNIIGSDLFKEIIFFNKLPNESTTKILNFLS
jgi:rfaE bifunctional protein nucleotidyltransferase chain/domain